MPPGNPFGVTRHVGHSTLFLGSLSCFCIYVIGQVKDVTVITCTLIGTDADQSTVHVHYSLFISTASLNVPATVMSKVTLHTRTSYSIAVTSKSESRGCSTSSASAVDQDMYRV